MGGVTQGQGYAVSNLQEMGDGPVHILGPGKDGYLRRDGQAVGGNPRGGPPGASA